MNMAINTKINPAKDPIVKPLQVEGNALVAILLATYNGAKFLAAQLDSIGRQSHSNWRVYASDDGSSDQTRAVLQSYSDQWGDDRLNIRQGPQRGHAENFMSLVRDENIKADYYAFCDQDDVWLEDKLSRSIHTLESIENTKPSLYGSRTTLIDEKGHILGLSPLFAREPGIKNALVQSLFGGNTILFNDAARNCFLRIDPQVNVIAHDWAAYLMVCACGGIVYYDEKPSLLYRQHDDNVIGSNNLLSDRFRRVSLLMKGRFKEYSDNNLAILSSLADILSRENANIVSEFREMRNGPLLLRLSLLKKIGLYRQTVLGNIGLWVAVLVNKI